LTAAGFNPVARCYLIDQFRTILKCYTEYKAVWVGGSEVKTRIIGAEYTEFQITPDTKVSKVTEGRFTVQPGSSDAIIIEPYESLPTKFYCFEVRDNKDCWTEEDIRGFCLEVNFTAANLK
jgi:hypothetical protein